MRLRAPGPYGRSRCAGYFARITKGLAAKITLDYLPGKIFEGKVAFVYPYLDPASRTPNYDDISLTENTRAAYPIEHIAPLVQEYSTGAK